MAWMIPPFQFPRFSKIQKKTKNYYFQFHRFSKIQKNEKIQKNGKCGRVGADVSKIRKFERILLFFRPKKLIFFVFKLFVELKWWLEFISHPFVPPNALKSLPKILKFSIFETSELEAVFFLFVFVKREKFSSQIFFAPFGREFYQNEPILKQNFYEKLHFSAPQAKIWSIFGSQNDFPFGFQPFQKKFSQIFPWRLGKIFLKREILKIFPFETGKKTLVGGDEFGWPLRLGWRLYHFFKTFFTKNIFFKERNSEWHKRVRG